MSSINRKTQYWKIIMLACGLAAILLGVIFAWIVRLESAISILAWPFIKTGDFLRSLSFRSEAGNILAILLYGGISLLPTGWIVLRSFPDYGWQTGMNISSDMLMGVVRMLLSLVPVLMTVLLVIKGMELLDELADRESQYRLPSVLI